MPDLTHLDGDGNVHMVDVGDKTITNRAATAICHMSMPAVCVQVLADGGETKKGNVFQVARLAGIMAAKKTSDLIPLCHPLPLTGIDIDIELRNKELAIEATVRCQGKTGVEMEALTAASVTALTVYDMLKALSHDMVIGACELLQKTGGKSGDVNRAPTHS